MLNVFRRKQTLVRWVLGVILFLVCLSMVITLIPGLTGDLGDNANNPVVAEVAGEKITQADVQQGVQEVSARNKIPPELMPYYTTQILNQMILQKVSLHEASRLGLKVDELEMQAALRQDQALFPNGGFVGQEQYEDMVSQRFGITVAQFEEHLRQELLLQKIRQLVTDSLAVPPEEVHRTYQRENEKMSLDYVAVNPAELQKEITAAEGDLERYLKENKDRYQVPDKRLAKILFFDQVKFRHQVPVSEAEVKKYYQDHLDTYRQPERVTVRHILLKADPKDPAQLAAAKAKAQDLLKKLKGGADFILLARENSDDKATAEVGGIIANVTRHQMVPEFEKAAFSLAPGALSEPVQTQYGIHIIKLITHDAAGVQPLSEVKQLIQLTLSKDAVNKLVADSTEQASQALARSPADIEAIAPKYHAEVLAPPPLSLTDNVPRIASASGVLQEIFSLEKNHAGAPIQIAEGYAIPVLLDVFPGHPAELQEVKEQVKKGYTEEQARAKAVAKAKELVKVLEGQTGPKDIKKAAKSLGMTVKTSPSLTRDGNIPSVGVLKDLLDPKALAQPVGATGGPVRSQDLQVVYQIASREPANEQEFPAKKAQLEERLLNEKRQVAFEVFQDNLRKKLASAGDLKMHSDVIGKLTSPASSRP